MTDLRLALQSDREANSNWNHTKLISSNALLHTLHILDGTHLSSCSLVDNGQLERTVLLDIKTKKNKKIASCVQIAMLV